MSVPPAPLFGSTTFMRPCCPPEGGTIAAAGRACACGCAGRTGSLDALDAPPSPGMRIQSSEMPVVVSSCAAAVPGVLPALAPKPVATTVTRTLSSKLSSTPIPQMMFA